MLFCYLSCMDAILCAITTIGFVSTDSVTLWWQVVQSLTIVVHEPKCIYHVTRGIDVAQSDTSSGSASSGLEKRSDSEIMPILQLMIWTTLEIGSRLTCDVRLTTGTQFPSNMRHDQRPKVLSRNCYRPDHRIVDKWKRRWRLAEISQDFGSRCEMYDCVVGLVSGVKPQSLSVEHAWNAKARILYAFCISYRGRSQLPHTGLRWTYLQYLLHESVLVVII